MYQVRVYKDRQGSWRWRVIARNGRIVADSAESYIRRGHCRKMALQLFDFPVD